MELKVAAQFVTIGEAEAARSALEAAGIECHLADGNLVGIAWNMSQAVGGVKLLVRDEDLASAREVLAGNPVEDRQPSLSQPGLAGLTVLEPARCPECGSADFSPIPRVRIFLLVAAIFIGIGAAVGEELIAATGLVAVAIGALLMPSARCNVCGDRWTPARSHLNVEAPLPDVRDTIEEKCPRCGSVEVYSIPYRRLKAIPLLINTAIFAVLPVWLFMPKRRCDGCGLQF